MKSAQNHIGSLALPPVPIVADFKKARRLGRVDIVSFRFEFVVRRETSKS